MVQITKQGDELMALATSTETHMREQGHEVKAVANAEVNAFELRKSEGDDLLSKVQAVGDESFEIVRLNGETLSGFGDERVLRIMLERVIGDVDRHAA